MHFKFFNSNYIGKDKICQFRHIKNLLKKLQILVSLSLVAFINSHKLLFLDHFGRKLKKIFS